MADFPAARAGHATDLANRVWRKIVVEHEVLLVSALKQIHELLVLAGAQSRNHQSLGFSAREKSAAMRSRKDSNLGDDRPDSLEVPAIDTPAGLNYRTPHDPAFQLLEQLAEKRLRNSTGFLTYQGSRTFRLDRINAFMTFGFFGNLIRRIQVPFGVAREQFTFRYVLVGMYVPRLFRSPFRQPNNAIDHILHLPVTEHHRTQHHIFRQFFRFRFDHQNCIRRTCNDKVEARIHHFVDLRVELVLARDVPDTGRADRTHERNAGKRQCR